MDEMVLGFPANYLDRLGRFQGFCDEPNRYIEECVRLGVSEFRLRSSCETDPNFKQVIPYIVFSFKNLYFCYYRGKDSGEQRLKGKRSLGVGGHVNSSDAQGEPTMEGLLIGLHREIEEEVNIDPEAASQPRLIGLINDDSNDVGRVHLGLVFAYELGNPRISPKEDHLAKGALYTRESIIQNIDDFEGWSQIFISNVLVSKSAQSVT